MWKYKPRLRSNSRPKFRLIGLADFMPHDQLDYEIHMISLLKQSIAMHGVKSHHLTQ